MADIKLPKLPLIPLFMDDSCRDEIASIIRARDIEVARCVLEAAAKVLTDHQIPVGNSAAGEMACAWAYDALKECRDEIHNLKVSHD